MMSLSSRVLLLLTISGRSSHAAPLVLGGFSMIYEKFGGKYDVYKIAVLLAGNVLNRGFSMTRTG